MEQLINDKVDAFWKGIEGGANKRGQIIVTFSEKRQKKSWFQVYVGEVRSSISELIVSLPIQISRHTQEEVPWEQWSAFALTPIYELYPIFRCIYRIINAEIRQPKSEQGWQPMALISQNLKDFTSSNCRSPNI
jgi:hypothetical protein